jgi:acyl-CoA thioester hydrolase
MTRPDAAAAAGALQFRLPVRVYYQDTDAGGVVFHAAYLHFLERARTEFLRSIGFDIGRLAAEGVLFALHRLEMEFLRPARLDDALVVTSAIGRLGRSSAQFVQSVELPDGGVAARATLSLVCVCASRFRPMGMPEALRAALESWTLPACAMPAPRGGPDNGVGSTG